MESQEQTMPRSFEEVVLPHLDAAFNYARWLTKNDADAEDARAWLLTIVRNTWYGRFRDAREVP
jgi:RNA polymerase sigma-70 factor, ECF subfamily